MIFDRTFHPDEANQAFTVGKLLETGTYTYRPEDHHGPTLYYAAAPVQKAFGHDSTATLDGTLLRCTPLLFALLGLLFGFLALRRLTKSWCIPALFVILLGTSPIFVFFATDFIQEMLLACFTLMIFWAGAGYLHPGRKWKPGTWAILFGVAGGLAFATKETSVLSFAAAGFAGFPFVWQRRTALRSRTRDVVLAMMGFALTATILFTSFCSNWHGLYDAFIAAPLSYLNRATGSAASTGAAWHVHPWWQYLYWLFAADRESLPFFALCGICFAIFFRFAGQKTCIGARVPVPSQRRAFLFATSYFLFLFAFYSLIPYKTPWCTLQLHTALLLAALLGFTVSSDVYTSENMSFVPPSWWPASWKAHAIWWQRHPRLIKAFGILPLTLASTILFATNCRQCIHMNQDPDSKDIRFNYASASPEVKDLAASVADAMGSATNGANAFIAVALPPEDTWPFPWYNRALEARTGYWTNFNALRELAKSKTAPTVVIVPMTEGHLVQPLFPHLQNTKRFYMRPGVRVRAFW